MSEHFELFGELVSKSLNISYKQVANTIKLINEGATIPFISRYRKEMTGSLDEIQISEIAGKLEGLIEINKRKDTILKTIEDQGCLTSELKAKIVSCWDSVVLEDIYLPYKPKKRTRAEIAKELGLEPLAKIIMAQNSLNISASAGRFLNDKVKSVDEAIKGAKDIIAEWVNESELARNITRRSFQLDAIVSSKLVKGKEDLAQKYKDYFNFSEKLSKCSSHRLLALLRAEKEGFLRISIDPDDDICMAKIKKVFVRTTNDLGILVEESTEDAYKRLIKPSIENEFASESKLNADKEAIRVFSENLKQLLFASPLGEKRTLALDPGFRTGCKVVCLDAQGNLLHNETIYPHPPQNDYSKATASMRRLVESYKIEAIAIGNGTAGRETESFIKNIRFDRELKVFAVNEAGASIYSASKIAREEFPQYDVTVRGAVSIGRRLMDPLAELVKIDPKSIGVGQYQHDVDQSLLKKSLDQTVEFAVNKVGVNLNTASKHLLTYVSGVGPQLAQNIVEYRSSIGSFKSRKELLKVPKLGAKTFEQCAGFLRIPSAINPLDNSAVHPESYELVQRMASQLNTDIATIIGNKQLLDTLNLNSFVDSKVGLPTLNDICEELLKPGLDPRTQIKEFEFDESIRKMEDLRLNMELPGIVTNLTNFGAFVDIGIKENGLIHISKMSDKFISNPSEVLSLNQHVKIKVIEIDFPRKRIQLQLIEKI